jgi:3,4-dihydroxy-2-butanone 4-phosphate synthase
LLTLVCAAEQMTKRTMDMLYVRGDGVILVSPPLRTS